MWNTLNTWNVWEYAEGPPVLQHERWNWSGSSVGTEQEELCTESKAERGLWGSCTGLTLLEETGGEKANRVQCSLILSQVP